MDNIVKENEKIAFDLMVNIVDAYEFRDRPMLRRRLQAAQEFLAETFSFRNEALEKFKLSNEERRMRDKHIFQNFKRSRMGL